MSPRVLSATGALLVALACTRGTTPAPDQQAQTTTLTRRLEADVSTLNWVLQTTDYERWVLSYLYDPLLNVDEDLEPAPGTAKAWEISADGLTYTFHLDPQSTFSDHTPVRATDVLFTIHKITEAQSPEFSSYFDGVDFSKSAAVDDRTVRVVFREPRVTRWFGFNIGILPEHVYSKGDFKTAFTNTVVGNGPYRLARREPGRSITLERRTGYRGRQPSIDRVVFKVIADASVAWHALKRGDIDEMRVKPDVWRAAKDDPQVTSAITFYDILPLSYNCIAWNEKDPILRDAAVRRALSMCFDRQSIIQNLYFGRARAISGPFTPDLWQYNSAIPPVSFDPDGAAALLERAGWRDTDGDGIRERNGQPLSIDLLVAAGDSAAGEQSQIFQQALKHAGVASRILPRDGASMFSAVMKGSYQGAFMAWSLDPEPDIDTLFNSKQQPPAGFNIVHYVNPEVDRLLAATYREFNVPKRRDLFHQLHAILAADQPYTWTIQPAQKWAVSRRVQNVRVSHGYGLYLWYPGALEWSVIPR